jgi:hypothetical protein
MRAHFTLPFIAATVTVIRAPVTIPPDHQLRQTSRVAAAMKVLC